MTENTKKPFYHFSIDDVFDSLIEISAKENPLAHPFFSFIEELHDEFGTNADLYCFYQKKINEKLYTLRDVTESHKSTFAKNGWIRFGPHGLDYGTPPYSQSPQAQTDLFDQIYQEISRFAGDSTKSKLVRLHYFSESYELADYFHKNGVITLLTTDKPALSHRMPDNVKADLEKTGRAEYNGMSFMRSHIRAENLANENLSESQIYTLLDSLLGSHGFIVFLTHEYELSRHEVRSALKLALRYLSKKGIRSL